MAETPTLWKNSRFILAQFGGQSRNKPPGGEGNVDFYLKALSALKIGYPRTGSILAEHPFEPHSLPAGNFPLDKCADF
jgi:hypothetical protein